MNRAYNIGQLAKITGGEVIGDPGLDFSFLATDSRALPGVRDVLFIALTGKNHDGHHYIEDLYHRGIRCFMTERRMEKNTFPEASFCVVKDSLHALQLLAGDRRLQFPGT